MEMDEVHDCRSLKSCCLCVISRNKWLTENKNLLTCLPVCLVYDLCKYVSPYGLSLLEKQTSLLGLNIDHLYLTQWRFPLSYTLKARTRSRVMITSLHRSITNKQFFYDSLLNEVIEQLVYANTIDNSIEQAWSYFTQYPVKQGDQLCLEIKQVTVNIKEFMNLLSSHVTSLTVTSSVANPIIESIDIFSPILHSITDMNLNLGRILSPGYNVEQIVEIIRITRQYNLSSVNIKCNEKPGINNYECFNQIIKALCSPIENCTAMVIKNELELSDEIYDMEYYTNESECPLYSEESNTDLYDYVFERAGSLQNQNCKKVVDTQIVDFKLSVCQFPYSSLLYRHFFDYISRWKTLQKLSIHGYCSADDSKITDAFLALASYNNLIDLNLSDFWLSTISGDNCSEDALIELAKPSCRTHKKKHCLQKLRLYNCCYRKDFLFSILCDQCTKNDVNSMDQCFVNGLSTLKITLFSSTDLLPIYLMKNNTLKELIISKGYDDANNDYLLNAVADMSLHTFSLTSKFKRSASPPPTTLLKLFQHKYLTHLELSQVCNHDYLFNEDASVLEDILRMSKLTTFIWTKNGLGNNGLVELSGYISSLRFLKVLDLSGNLFNIDGVSIFLQSLHQSRRYFDKLGLGGPNVRFSDIKKSALDWIIDEHVNQFSGSYLEMDTSDHISQM